MYDIIIVGAGPAGLTATLYALRANKKVLVLEAKSYGGQIINAHKIENYPGISSISGYTYATNLFNQVIKLGMEIKYETVTRIEGKRVYTNKNVYEAKAIILATGAQNRQLKITDEEKYIGKGISYCATCDGNFYRDKIVAVVGGGNTALYDAIYLSHIANKVYLIHRRNTFKGEEKYLEELKSKKNVEFILNSTVTKLLGDEKLHGIIVTDKSLQKKEISIDCLFIAVGQEPKNEIFSNIVDLDKYGYIKSINDVYTKYDGIYVAGDARVKNLRQLTTAVADGAIAASEAIKNLRKEMNNNGE